MGFSWGSQRRGNCTCEGKPQDREASPEPSGSTLQMWVVVSPFAAASALPQGSHQPGAELPGAGAAPTASCFAWAGMSRRGEEACSNTCAG